MGRPNDLESIVEAAARLKGNKEIHFIFLGNGAKEKWLRSTVSELSLDNITILPPKPRAEQTTFLNACDVAIVTLVKKMKGVSMPSRTYNLLAAGKPILGIIEFGSELDRVVSEERVGWIVEPHDPEALVDTILGIYEDRSELPAMAGRARSAAETKYSLKVALEAYKATLK